MDRLLLETGLGIEVAKRQAVDCARKLHRQTLQVLEAYDEAHQQTEPCTNSILCQRENVRHRSGCPESPTWLGGELQW